MTADLTPFDGAPQMRQITIEIPLAVAQKMAESYEGTLEDATLTGLKLIHGMGMPTYTKLQTLAKHFETSVPKTLRTAINALAADAEKIAPTPAKIGRPKINEERDTAVYLQVTQGATYAETANTFGLSLVRVGQIMAQQRALRGVPSRRPRATGVAPTVWPATQAEVQDAEAYVRRTEKSPMFYDMGAGMSAAAAAEKYGVTEEQAQAGFAAYSAALPEGERATKGAKATASFAGLHAMEKPEEVLTLKEPAKPRFVLPGLRNSSTPAAPVDTRTAKERDVFNPEFGF